MCMKIADSEIFINWIGESLDKSLRYLIMFVICLNCTYFFTRITEQIINSSNMKKKIKVFYDGKCNICNKEINFYSKIDKKNKFEWINIHKDKTKIKKQE